jgi:hypothetical protein
MYKDGTEAVVSKKLSVVVVRPSTKTYTSEQRPTFVVSVFNGTDKPIVFSTENISASVDGSPLKVFSYDELVEELENTRKRILIAAALAGVAESISAAQAGNQYTYGNFTTRYYGNHGYYGSGYGTYSGYTYNPAAAAQAQAAANAQMNQNFANITSSFNAALFHLSSTILKKETVFPNQWHGGYITLQQGPIPESSNTLSLKVIFGEEEHNFEFVQTKVK